MLLLANDDPHYDKYQYSNLRKHHQSIVMWAAGFAAFMTVNVASNTQYQIKPATTALFTCHVVIDSITTLVIMIFYIKRCMTGAL